MTLLSAGEMVCWIFGNLVLKNHQSFNCEFFRNFEGSLKFKFLVFKKRQPDFNSLISKKKIKKKSWIVPKMFKDIKKIILKNLDFYFFRRSSVLQCWIFERYWRTYRPPISFFLSYNHWFRKQSSKDLKTQAWTFLKDFFRTPEASTNVRILFEEHRGFY